MKKTLRMSVISVLVLSALAFSAFSVMAMASAPAAVTPTTSATATSTAQKQEVLGTVTAIDATSIMLNGTVYTLSAATEIQGAIQAGDTVKLEIVTNADGSVTVYEVAKPDTSGSSADVSGTEPASIDPVGTAEPIGTETVSPDKLNVVDPTSTVEPVHTEVASPDKSNKVEPVNTAEPAHTEVVSPDKNNTASSPDKNGSSLDNSGSNSGNDSSQP